MSELEEIRNRIYEIRGRQVMLDFDLAALYGIETRILKQSVRRNLKRFEGEMVPGIQDYRNTMQLLDV